MLKCMVYKLLSVVLYLDVLFLKTWYLYLTEVEVMPSFLFEMSFKHV